MNAKISFRDVSRTYRVNDADFTAVDHVSLDVADREFVTVVGPSGCGKSTLLGMAAGLVAPTGERCSWTAGRSPAPGPTGVSSSSSTRSFRG